jgi:hypothetical protein
MMLNALSFTSEFVVAVGRSSAAAGEFIFPIVGEGKRSMMRHTHSVISESVSPFGGSTADAGEFIFPDEGEGMSRDACLGQTSMIHPGQGGSETQTSQPVARRGRVYKPRCG